VECDFWPEMTPLGIGGAPQKVITISGGQKYGFWAFIMEESRRGGISVVTHIYIYIYHVSVVCICRCINII